MRASTTEACEPRARAAGVRMNPGSCVKLRDECKKKKGTDFWQKGAPC